MNLLDKYMLEVGERLPRKNRTDLQAEIRSTIEDMLEDCSRESGRPVDDTLIGEVLQKYGAPDKVAAAYQPTRYLVGPRLYPFFTLVVRIVFSVLTVLALVGFSLNFARGGEAAPDFLAALGKYGLQYLTGIITAFGNIVLVFAILERVLPTAKFDEEVEKWSPADLDAVEDPNRVKRGELIFEILFIMLGLALLNLYPDLIGFGTLQGGAWISVPLLSDAFFRYLPWINLLGVLEILLDLYLLRQGIWHTAARLFKLATEAAGVLLAVVMLFGPALVGPDPQKLAEVLGSQSAVISRLLNFVPWIVLTVVIVVQSVEALGIAWWLFNRREGQKTLLQR